MRLNVLLCAIASSWIVRSSCFRGLFGTHFRSYRGNHHIWRVNSLCLWNHVDIVENAERGTFVESFELQNWGLFENSILSLGSAPLFAVITGETGSGKSVLISALQYLYSSSGIPQKKNSKSGFFTTESDSQSAEKVRSIVTLKKGGEEYIKTYDAANRKTVCELNGKKTTIKNVMLNLKGDVRFWSSESIFLLDPGPSGFVNYVDKNLCEKGSSLLPLLEEIFTSWTASYEELMSLRLLKKRKDDDDEVETFSNFLDEVGAFDLKIQKVLVEIFHNLNEINDALFSGQSDSHVDGTQSNPAAAATPSVVDKLLDLVVDCLPELTSQKRHDTRDYIQKKNSIGDSGAKGRNEMESRSVKLWSATLSAYDFLSTFFEALEGSLSTPENKNSNLGNKNRNKEKINIQEFGFDTITTIIEEYENKIIDLQKEFRALNFPKTVLDTKIENLHNHFQNIESSVAKAKKEIFGIQNCLPLSKTNEIVSKIQILKSECDKLCRRHDAGNYMDLQKKMGKWENERNQMENLIFTLPESEKQEMKHRERYTETALDLTECRISAANSFILRINDLLPQLEMKDKHIGVRFDLTLSSTVGSGENEERRDADSAELKSLFVAWRSHRLDSGTKSSNASSGSSNINSNSAIDTSSNPDDTSNTVRKEMVKLISRNLRPKGEITGRGWDDVSLSVRPYRGSRDAPTPSETPVGMHVRVELKNSHRKNTYYATEDGEEEVEEVEEEEEDASDGSVAVSVLSSGESTRLALAMETCTHSAAAGQTPPAPADTPGHPPRIGTDSGNALETAEATAESGLGGGQHSSLPVIPPLVSEPGSMSRPDPRSSVNRQFESLLIFDEIDAHIGGEAALAVAKLLKEQGKWRQVVVVTHNPLVASLADRHFVVSKRAEGSEKLEHESREESAGENHGNTEVDNDNGNGLYKTDRRRSAGAGTGPARMSTLSEVCGASRELEISRMATGGGVLSAAGLALARALLGSQSDGSTADSAD